jgi:phosphoribosylglycinamide formyltransferase 1
MSLRIIWFSSGRDQAALDLLKVTWQKIEEGFLSIDIPLIFISQTYGESRAGDCFIEWVKEKNIPLRTLSALGFEPEKRKKDLASWRLAYDQEIVRRLKDRSFDWIFLAGYMWIVSPLLVRQYRLFNLHPAPPGGPKGTWQEVIWETLKNKLPEAGAQIHLVTEGLDEGPPLTYVTFSLQTPEWEPLWKNLNEKVSRQGWSGIVNREGEERNFFVRLRERELSLEFPLILWTLKILETGHLTVKDRKVYWDENFLPRGYCLNREIFGS